MGKLNNDSNDINNNNNNNNDKNNNSTSSSSNSRNYDNKSFSNVNSDKSYDWSYVLPTEAFSKLLFNNYE